MLENFGLQQAWWAGIMDHSWPIMSFLLGLVDGFNPCAMWTLFILIGFLLSINNQRHRWLIGGVFIASSGIIYLLALLTYLFGFKAITQMLATSVMHYIFWLIGLIAILTGIINLLNYRKKKLDCEIRDTASKQRFTQKIETILASKKLWIILIGITILAFSVNAFELLCSFAIPTIFTTTLIHLDLPLWQQFVALGLYDVAYILDDLVIFTIAIKTLSLKVFSQKLIQRINLFSAILLIIVGFFLIFDSQNFVALFS